MKRVEEYALFEQVLETDKLPRDGEDYCLFQGKFHNALTILTSPKIWLS